MTHQRTFVSLLLVSVLGLSPGCVVHHRVSYKPPLAKNAGQIVKGQTTRKQLFEWFGYAYMEADGARSRINPESPLARWGAKNTQNALTLDWLTARPCYSGIDDDWVSFLYLEIDIWFAFVYNPYMVAVGYGQASVRRNKLLVFVNKKTDVVEDFGFWKEF